MLEQPLLCLAHLITSSPHPLGNMANLGSKKCKIYKYIVTPDYKVTEALVFPLVDPALVVAGSTCTTAHATE